MRKLLFLMMTLFATHSGAQVDGDEKFRALIQAAPVMAADRLPLRITPSVELESVSAVAADETGNLYILQRGPHVDPVVAR